MRKVVSQAVLKLAYFIASSPHLFLKLLMMILRPPEAVELGKEKKNPNLIITTQMIHIFKKETH